jgi:hypothetical protein
MIETKLLAWLYVISQWYIIVPLFFVILRWKSHDTIRRRVAWYILFNIGFVLITMLLARLKINNLFIFYLTSPAFLWIVYKIFEPEIGGYKTWKFIQFILIGFTIFVLIDMFFIENYKTKFPDNIYPPQEVIILIIVYFYLYIFSKEARKDFSMLWISIGICVSALILLIILLYSPTLGLSPNTIGYFINAGLSSFSEILSYSFIAYGLYIARPTFKKNA